MLVHQKLYISHFLTSWVDRSFEFASYLLIAKVFTSSLLQSSLYGLITTLAALLLSNRIGNWINLLSRLQTYRITLLTQKLSIVISTLLFYVLDRSDHNRTLLYAFIIVLGCTLKLAFIGNSIAIEKDWAMIISDGHIELLLPTMRRIDLICKTLSPILIGPLLLAPSWVVATAISAWTVVSTLLEYILISQIHRDVPELRSRAPYNSSATPGAEEEAAAVEVTAREYIHHKTFLATLALGMLYMNVLSFGGTMTSYLVLIGYNSGLLGIMKAVCGIMGVAGTYLMPLLAKKIGTVRTGLWSIWQLALTLAVVVIALTNRQSNTATSVLLFGGMALSRLGLWMFDIAENLILQDYTEPVHITSIAGWQYSLCNLFDLLQFALTIAVSDPARFIIPASISLSATAGAAIIYTLFVWKDRGHLLHLKLK
ncbi:hypothetical protein BGZ70_004043 [Mortierella alpina]|uniref:Solute carrier family 40 member n=1 Tax=Mortierella alpina TaxID=64518 RepID=A0A9P6IRV1_MORAP|nr:hypothetical protein BGZ70_004043 [Mortierella alpina]